MKPKRKIKEALFAGFLLLFVLGFVSDAKTQSCVAPPTGLVGWWPGDGNADDIQNGNDGTLINGATVAPGMVGQAFSFDGADDDVIVAHNPNLNLAEFTLDAWIKADPDVSRHRPIVAKEDDLSSTPWFNRNYWFGLNIFGGQLLLIISSGGSIQIISGPALNDGQWHHVAATRAANGAAKLYVDGVLTASGSLGMPDFSGSPLHIGRWGINSAGAATGGVTDRSSFKGLMDEVEIFNRALAASEIQSIFTAGSAGKCKAQSCVVPPTGLVGWWPGDGNADDIQNGNDGTLINGATVAPGKVGQAFSFDGVNDRVDVPDALNLDMTAAVTLDAWVKPNSFATCPVSGPFGTCAVVAKSSFLAGTRNYGMWILHDGRVHVEGGGFGRGAQTLPGLVPVGTFTHVAAVLTPPSVQIYVNGVPQPVTGSINPLTPNNVPLTIGASDIGTHNFNFNGLIDEVEIFNRALSAAEIQSIFTAGSAGMCTAQSCVAPPAGLVSWWPGEGNGDDIVGGNDGTLQGGVTFVPGRVGQAFKFDTSPNSYIALPNSPDFTPASNQVTISAWIKPDFAVANFADIIFVKRDGCGFNRSYGLAVSKAGAIPFGYPLGTIVWSASVAGDDVTPSTRVPNDGQFHHIAGTYDGTAMRVYMDGVLIGEKPHTGPIPATSAPPFIGLNAGCSGQLSAAVIDEIEFRNRALSAQEIQAIYNAGSAGICQAPADTTPPVITPTVNGLQGSNGWYVSSVLVSWAVSDPESAITATSGCNPTTISSDTAGTTLTCSATSAGGTASQSVTVKRDATPPAVIATRSPGANPNGWNNADVVVTASGTDGTSGIDACTSATVSAEGTGQAVTVGCTDKAGNNAPVTVSGINIDKTAPSVIYLGNAGTYSVDQTVAITCTASDNLSGVASNTCANINGPAYTFALGTNSFSASATDLAGNTGSGSTSFTVVVTYESLRSLTRQFVGQRGILNSLEAKLNAAEAAAARGNANAKQGAITAYINEVQAQSGKALTADQAAILIRLAQAL